ncbi:hypothetical protein BD560DRAFT_379532 [Blakeslea trispora]|nr:hypothetical protein BD560DRAFT_379532 [Blakeslea trispora]
MALSANDPNSKTGGLAPNPPNNKPQRTTPSSRSWSQIVGRNERKSLLGHKTALSPPPPSASVSSETVLPQKIIKSQIWRPGHGVNSLFIDMSGRKETKLEFFKLVALQYPTRVGVLTQQVGSLRFAEINFPPNDKDYELFLEKGLCMNNQDIIMPCRALASNMEVMRIRLSKLPFLKEVDLLQGLEQSLSPYGQILDVGIFIEPETQTYTCTGYAILNIHAGENMESFKPLSHCIPWNNSQDSDFYAVWNQMPKYCKYCHQEDIQ